MTLRTVAHARTEVADNLWVPRVNLQAHELDGLELGSAKRCNGILDRADVNAGSDIAGADGLNRRAVAKG